MEEFSYARPIIMNFVKYFIFAGIPFLIFYVFFGNKFLKNKIQSRFAKQKDFVREILHSIQTNIIISTFIVAIALSPLLNYTQIYLDVATFPIWWIPVSVLLALILHDTYFYWTHRALHHPVLYKKTHLLHHQSTNPSPWTSFSFGFMEGIIEGAIFPLVVFLIPVHPLALVLIGFISISVNVYGHLGYEIAPKWLRNSFLFEILITSVHHNIHHEKFRGNYGFYFRIWDRLMGTEHPDYVREFDIVQERRFGTGASVAAVSEKGVYTED